MKLLFGLAAFSYGMKKRPHENLGIGKDECNLTDIYEAKFNSSFQRIKKIYSESLCRRFIYDIFSGSQ